MPTIKSISVFIDGKQVYRAGEEIKGHWTIDVGEELSVRGVRLALRGAAYTRWDNVNPKMSDKIGYEQIISKWTTVFGTKLGEKSSGSHILPAGKHQYKFSFRVPSDRLPSSYEGEYGAIRYWLYLEIDRPIFRFNITRMKTITILENIDVNSRQFLSPLKAKTEKKVSKAVVLGNAGTVTLDVQTDRRAYCPGEKIFITLVANNDTDRDLGPLKATLIQHVTFIADGDEKNTTTRLQSVTGKSLPKGEKRKWTRQQLTIPATPHTTMDRACRIINVKYTLKVVADIPLLNGGDATVTLPITIGTIPQGHSTTSAGASNSFEIDASAAIAYAQCTRGYNVFSEGEKQFPVTNYIPWCTYVPNFQQPAALPKQSTGKPNTSGKPLPSKTPIQNKTNKQPSTVLPTAPPLREAPPSYDDVMKETATEKNQKGDHSTSAKPTSLDTDGATGTSKAQLLESTILDNANIKAEQEVLMIVRFPDKVLNQFRRILADCPDLPSNPGKVVAVAPQVIVNFGNWPQRTSIALIMFPSHQDATEWFEQAVDVFSGNNVAFQDVAIVKIHEKFDNAKNIFSMKTQQLKPGTEVSRLKEYATFSKQFVTPLRKEIGGVVLVAAKVTDHMTGNWPELGSILTLSQWDSLKHLEKYKRALEADTFKPFISLYKEIYDCDLSMFFQSEELSYLEEQQGSYLEEEQVSGLQEQQCLDEDSNVTMVTTEEESLDLK